MFSFLCCGILFLVSSSVRPCVRCFVPRPTLLSNLSLAKNKLVSFAAPRFLFYAFERCDDDSGNGDRPPNSLALSLCGCLLFILAACGTIIVQSICSIDFMCFACMTFTATEFNLRNLCALQLAIVNLKPPYH